MPKKLKLADFVTPISKSTDTGEGKKDRAVRKPISAYLEPEVIRSLKVLAAHAECRPNDLVVQALERFIAAEAAGEGKGSRSSEQLAGSQAEPVRDAQVEQLETIRQELSELRLSVGGLADQLAKTGADGREETVPRIDQARERHTGPASVDDVVAAICHELLKARQPLSYKEALRRLTVERKMVLPGEDPSNNIHAIVRKGREQGVLVTTGDRKIWIAGMDASREPSLF